jgi:alanine-glyoxylate transaminase / serine-glyoxylate transaminase / serine-pyruvate transaminase
MSFAALQPPQRFLFGPGPGQVEDRVYRAMSQPIVGHLDPFFFSVVNDIRTMLRDAFGTRNEFTMAISGTGSAGMETAVNNFLIPGQKMLVFCAGYFADRLSEMGRRYGAEVVRIEHPWGEVFSVEEVQRAIREHRPNVIGFVQAETSTGAFQDATAITQAAKEVDALVIADCVTSLGAMPVRLDEQGIDIAYSCSQKGLSCPPGLSPITANERAMNRLRARKDSPRSWYLDLKLLDEYFDGAHRYHHTAPITMFYALREGLLSGAEEGWETRWKRHHSAHQRLVGGLQKVGMQMHVKEGDRIWNLNTPLVPSGIDDLEVRKRMMSRHGIEIAGGLGQLAGKVFRVGIMGPLATPEKVDFVLDALTEALKG